MKNMSIPILIMMVGLPGSGKTLLAHDLADKLNAQVFSSDVVRAEVCGESYSSQDNQRVFPILHDRIKGALQKRQNVIYDATNIRARDRKTFLKYIRG
ncbi:MAG: ATP-binding protein, partial [Eubacterium sp.]|nr:ATP-binding protein [Eubacterium sp.]